MEDECKKKCCFNFSCLFKPECEDAKQKIMPTWLEALGAAALFLMLNQIKFPVFGGRIAVADIAFLAGFVPMFVWCLLNKRGWFYPVMGVIVLALAGVTNLKALSGCGGAFECAQLVQYLLCGVLMISFLLESAPGLTAFAVFAALVLNLVTAGFQAIHYGIGSILAPADVLSVSWGFGGAFTGLFRSRMALSFFSAGALLWLYPQIIGKNNSVLRNIVSIVLVALGLLGIVHGQMLLIAIVILLIEAFVYSRRAGYFAIVSVILALAMSACLFSGNHFKTVSDTLYPVKDAAYAGELKTNHIDFIAALRMAEDNPLAGVGSGAYQSKIGTYYRELPNPAYNDIATDTQAGWGIISATTGFVTAGVLALLLLSSIGAGLRRFASDNDRHPLALGGASLLALVFVGMFISDPMTRGLAWMLALGLASVAIPRPNEKISSTWIIMPGTVLVVGIVLCLLFGANAVFGKCGESGCCKKTSVTPATEQPVAVEAKETPKPVAPPVIPMLSVKTYKPINADAVLKTTPPFQVVAGTNGTTASAKILEVLDNAGKPPEGKEPSMEYGGAVFQVDVPSDDQYRIWLRVWWEGSCGNTVSVQIDDEKKSVTAGNDSAYSTWHWVSVPRVYALVKGTHVITVLNREDGIKLDQILVTNDANYTPSGIEK